MSAKDLSTGKSQNIKITAQSGLNEDEIKRAVEEAERFRQEDEKRQEMATTRNNLDNLVYQTEKTLKEQANLPAAQKTAVEEAIQSAKKVLDNRSASLDELRSAFNQLQAKAHELSTHMASGAAAAGNTAADSASSNTGTSGGKDDVIDVDFKDVN